jgi:hypothetical protein
MMMTKWRNFAIATTAAVGLGSPAWASTVVLDWSPIATAATVTGPAWANEYAFQHFAESVSFKNTTTIVGMDIYAADWTASIGKPVIVSIYGDSNGTPGDILVQHFVQVTEVDSVGAPDHPVGGIPTWTTPHNVLRVHADFDGFQMLAEQTYWIGMAGEGYTLLTQAGLSGWAGGDGQSAWFGGGDYRGGVTTEVGDLAMRLYADNTVPEPSSNSLFALAFAATLMSVRLKGKTDRRRQ